MKNILLIITLLFIVKVNCQIIQKEDFEILNLGDLGSPANGVVAGQGNWYSQNGLPTDYQIVSYDEQHGKSIQLIGSKNKPKYVFKGNFSVADLQEGNNIIKVTFDVHTGRNFPGGSGSLRSMLYEPNRWLAGIGIDYATGEARGYIQAKSTAGEGLHVVKLGKQKYPTDSWVSLGYYFDLVTGNAYFQTPEGTFGLPATLTPIGGGSKPDEHDFMNYVPTTGSSIAHTIGFDNYSAEAIGTVPLGLREAISEERLKVEIYPNPASEFINVISENIIKSVTIFDATGKSVKSEFSGKKLNLRHLSPGNYILKVQTDSEITTQKFIKK
ncbi:Por secretion system C-terminal sorting domain-containing protein [Cruoricaptor ignavus]|uniref:Por secretion system C-terminal sorting domain-containing protein n=1 Tax=Cruoricaptor ignavus TaxID=1118202 RepID=A0A1M6EHB2_9FLAO|nr:T9SS type A sorting domain-containing protein [Cruoricaptor ignavus]SHI84823.1 Por secretion system C-terminal sorting domain-containing protein [Cruoricaptor ignavus]